MRPLRIQQWSLGRIADAIDGRLISPSIDIASPTAVATDTRTIENGELFFALRGDRFDGHDFLDVAVEAGALAVVVDDLAAVESKRTAAIVVDDCIAALGRLGHAIWQEAREEGLRAVAVTGSNGKTTTKELLAALWKIDGSVWATPGNLNNHIGLPLTLCALPADCDHLIVEMGANHRGEISELIKLAPADQRIITSIGRAHLEGFGSLAGVRRAKSEIFEGADAGSIAVVPYGEHDKLMLSDFPGTLLTFGEDSQADLRIVSAQTIFGDGAASMEVVLETDEKRWTLLLPFVGKHNTLNLAAAMATLVSQRVDVDAGSINQMLSSVSLPAGRLRMVNVGALEIMDDAYNANPSSMRASFRAFEDWRRENIEIPAVAVIGDMYELGKSSLHDHQSLAQWLAKRPNLRALVFVGEFGPVMKEAASTGAVDEILATTDLDELAQWLADLGSARVFLKGSRGNRLERVVEKLESRS